MTEKHKSQRSESSNGPEGRFAYIFAHEKREKRANGTPLKTPRYDVVYLLSKTNADPAQCTNYQYLAKHCMDAATKAWGSFPQGGHWPIQDGDAPPKPKAPVPGQTAEPAKDYPWRKGNWVVELTNYMDPGPRVAVMQNGKAVEIPARVVNGVAMYKSGDYGVPHICAYSFHNEKFGVNFGFEGILFTKPGEPIGSSGPKSASQMFGSVAPVTSVGPAPVASPPMAPAPQQYAAPPVAPAPQSTQQYAAPPVAPAPQAYAHPGPPMAPVPGAAGLPPLPGR